MDGFQEIYLNVFAFAVFGFTAGELFQNGTGFILLAGVAFNAGVEYLQFRLDVGFAELDDVFSNAFGTLLGTVIHQNTDRYITAVKRLGAAWRKR